MNRKEVFYFTGKCLALEEKPEFRNEIVEIIKSDKVDWEQFVVLCSNHLILPAIYLKFKSYDILSFLPVDLEEHLCEVHQLNVVRNNQILKQLKEVTGALSEKGIHPIFLKGSAQLLDGLYSDVGERIMSDVDFLVSEKDYFTSAEVMKSIGYSEVHETQAWADISKSKHYPRLFRADCVANIEIHRIPVDEKYVSWFNTEMIASEKSEVSFLSGCYVPSDRNKIIHNFIHSQLANEGNLLGNVSLREIYDLSLLSKRYSLDEALLDIKEKQKAIAYFAFSGQVLGLNKSFYPKKNFACNVLLKKHNLNLKSDWHEKTIRSIVFIGQRIFVGYIGLGLKLFYSKEKRKYFYSRITNKAWYTSHLKLYTRFFKENK